MNHTNTYTKTYNREPDGVSFCPYRVCPIGAHSDHQYGKITGFAIDKGIHIAYGANSDGVIKLSSLNFPDKNIRFHINDIPVTKQNDWADYLRGATIALSRNHPLHTGLCGIIEGSLPIGGLSSSAAVIISFLSALCNVNNIKLSKNEMIMTALDAENSYVGVSCGKLDQSCEVYCKKDHLLYLDTKDDSFELIPKHKNMKPFEIAIFFSGVERTLAGSKFNSRVNECNSAAEALMEFEDSSLRMATLKKSPESKSSPPSLRMAKDAQGDWIASQRLAMTENTRLRSVPYEIYQKHKDKLPLNQKKRAEHFYTEFIRVEKGAEAWRNGDIEAFGRLSFESGHSSIVNYETGSPELIELYEIMKTTDGIYGGRFSGAGFKGCCMAIIDPDYKDNIKQIVTQKYIKVFPGLRDKFAVFFCNTADGAVF